MLYIKQPQQKVTNFADKKSPAHHLKQNSNFAEIDEQEMPRVK